MPRLSADELSAQANLPRLFAQRNALQAQTIPIVAQNWQRSVFYQTNLKDMAQKYAQHGWSLPKALPEAAPLMTRIHDAMFRSEALRQSDSQQAAAYDKRAFDLLREGLTENVLRHKSQPHMTTFADQIVWARSSVRIDVAGGWTDTPPYSLTSGGNVVNMAINLNGQPPLQVYVKPCKEPVIICRSIDLGAMERIETYDELQQYNKVGSPFSIPKAALTLAGFMPNFGVEQYQSLRQQLEAFGCGLEITLLAAIPARYMHLSRRRIGRIERLLRFGLGQERNLQPHPRLRAVAHYGGRLAGPIRRCTPRHQTLTDDRGIRPKRCRTLAARNVVCRPR